MQLDHPNGGIVTYWASTYGGSTKINDVIVPLHSGIQANTWYRFRAEITKLTATSARIDVSLVELDGSGNPTGTPITGSIANTDTWTARTTCRLLHERMVPSYKNYTAVAATADNTCYQVVTSTAPTCHILTLSLRRSG